MFTVYILIHAKAITTNHTLCVLLPAHYRAAAHLAKPKQQQASYLVNLVQALGTCHSHLSVSWNDCVCVSSIAAIRELLSYGHSLQLLLLLKQVLLLLLCMQADRVVQGNEGASGNQVACIRTIVCASTANASSQTQQLTNRKWVCVCVVPAAAERTPQTSHTAADG